MTRDELQALHVMATEVRDLAHEAYKIALKNRQVDGDSRAAYDTLLKANHVLDRIYSAIIKLALQP